MSHTRVAELLEARLGEWADAKGVPVVWENISENPPDTLYLQAYAMPATTTTIDLAEKLQVLPGVWQINVVAKAGGGVSGARTLADEVAALFPVGLALIDRGLTCYISTPPTVYRGISSNTNYSIPVSMMYRAQIVTG
ncbi:phage tail terminator-like protein [Serratia ureilytica]|uniref:phage tail terminator-like protein n=1 Tax=Serratia ureilytica TaxID=300181 RepID=UPI00164EF4B9|nr:phage tail terminator-like protein [Serratia ureilytica]